MAIKNIEDMKLTELIKPETLQRVQESFSELTHMAAVITDADGNPVTKGSNYTQYCSCYIRGSELGNKLCAQCDKYTAQRAYESGEACIHICHAGLIDFAAPIVADGHIAGHFVGGQVLADMPDEKSVRLTAGELMLDGDSLWEAALKVRQAKYDEIERAANYLYVLAGTFSDMAYANYVSMKATEEIMHATNAKSDFLANMSHEIRTPMNAVIGMAEMALREDLPPEARNYITQIKSSGRALLSIINDILDYSKIESGKMEINCVEYEPLSLINDVSSIIMTRLTDKDVELFLDINPDIPNKLYGDDLRIRQVIINIANNATKFTKSGFVRLTVDYKQKDEENIILKISVQDTGIGIKQEDMSRLFNSFAQVDSKRNRNVEGTGLGLAICRQLLLLMGGNITVDSEYGRGSTFSFEIPQKVIEAKPAVSVENTGRYAVAGIYENQMLAKEFKNICDSLSVSSSDFSAAADKEESLGEWLKRCADKDMYIVVEDSMFNEEVYRVTDMSHYPAMHVAVLTDAFSDIRKWKDLPNIQIIKKPLSVLNIAGMLGHKISFMGENITKEAESNYEAPDARVLIVDDNAINLTVAQGLLEPLKMQVDTALSGREALEKVDKCKYDIIFMDHMMPDLDGIETTRIIRRLHPECNETPIIALTANALSGAKEQFLSEGMNDFIAKPIEVRVLINKVRQWLPAKKIKKVSYDNIENKNNNTNSDETQKKLPDTIGDIDVKNAVKLLGTEKLYWKVLKDYYRVIHSKSDTIQLLKDQKDWSGYTVEVHALKSASRQIGAAALADMAAALERAGNARNIEEIEKYTGSLLIKYRSYDAILAPLFLEEAEENEEDRQQATDEILSPLFDKLREAIDNLDMDGMEEVAEAMGRYSYAEDKKEKYDRLMEAISNVDVDTCTEILDTWN